MLKKIDKHHIPIKQEIRLFSVIRNERERLPFFISYYQKKGVERFFFVDNDSNDKSREYLIGLNNPNVHVFSWPGSYNVFIKKYYMEFIKKWGDKNWCLCVDPDEYFKYPLDEIVGLKNFCDYLDERKSTALEIVLLDMYGKKSLKESIYKSGDDPFKLFQYFDSDTIVPENKILIGGLRSRIFGLSLVVLTKYPLIKVSKNTRIFEGFHKVESVKEAGVRGTLFHFKFTHLLPRRAAEEAKREEHWNSAIEYKAYVRKNLELLNLYYAKSKKYHGLFQLLSLRLMRISLTYILFVFKTFLNPQQNHEKS